MGPCLGRGCLARPRTSEPGACPSWEGGPSCPVRLSICQSIDRATFSHPPPSPSHGASRHHGGQGARKPRVTVLAFRHKPPPAKDRSENWLLPRSRLAGAAGRERTGSKPHIRTNPDEGFPRAHQTPFARGQPSSICSLSPTPTLSLSNFNIARHNCSKISRPPPNEEWRPESDQGRQLKRRQKTPPFSCTRETLNNNSRDNRCSTIYTLIYLFPSRAEVIVMQKTGGSHHLHGNPHHGTWYQ